MEVVKTILTVLEVIASVVLVAIVLMQSGKEGQDCRSGYAVGICYQVGGSGMGCDHPADYPAVIEK